MPPPLPPPTAWQPLPPGPPAYNPPQEQPPKLEGVTAKGLPLSQRGGLILEVAALRVPGASTPFAAVDVVARIPVAERTFFDAVLPFGFGAVGNPMAGAHHVFRPADRLWLILGGALGVPLINTNGFQTFSVARAFWDVQEFTRQTIPFALRFGLEAHVGICEIRAQADPVFGPPVSSGMGALFAFQHAVEVQLGHAIGGGVRYQGVAFGTKSNPLDPDDHYQGAFEAFFRLYRDPIFARIGLLLPLDTRLGEPNPSSKARSFGVRASTGFNLD
jgi:hypothetical protein